MSRILDTLFVLAYVSLGVAIWLAIYLQAFPDRVIYITAFVYTGIGALYLIWHTREMKQLLRGVGFVAGLPGGFIRGYLAGRAAR